MFTMPDEILVAVIMSAGVIVSRFIIQPKTQQQESIELRKELRDQIVYLNEQVSTLEAELDTIKKKYWEDVEIIYELRTETIKLQSTVDRVTEELDDIVSQNYKTNILYPVPTPTPNKLPI